MRSRSVFIDVDSSSVRDPALEENPRPQYLSDAPCLRETAARTVRRVTIKDLADRGHTRALQVLRNGGEQRLRQSRIAVHAIMSPHERPEQPGPHRAHVIGGIPLSGVARVAPDVARFLRAQTAKSVARQQFPAAAINDGPHLLGWQSAKRHRDRQNLVRSYAAVSCASSVDVEHVVQAGALRVPESAETRVRAQEQGSAEALLAVVALCAGEPHRDIE